MNYKDIKEIVEVNAKSQQIIKNAKGEKLNDSEILEIVELYAKTEEAKQYYMIEQLISNLRKSENLKKGSGSLIEYFNPEDVVEAYECDLTDDEFEELFDYAESLRVRPF